MSSTVSIAILAALAVAALAYAAVCVAVAWRFTTARRVAPQPAPAGAQPVRFAARDGRAAIDAWYLRAPAAKGAVVFVHGLGACRGDELKSPTFALARSLVENGLSVLMIDLRGHGSSSAARLTYGARERFDVLGAVDWLRARGHARIGALGASMGAATSLLAAADEPAIDAIVADSPFADFGLMIERQFRRLSRMPAWILPGVLALTRLFTGIDLQRVRPLEAAASLAGRPALVIHSAGDRFIPAADARAIAGRAGAQLWVTDNDGHIGSYRADPQAYTTRVVTFLCRHLTPAARDRSAPAANADWFAAEAGYCSR